MDVGLKITKKNNFLIILAIFFVGIFFSLSTRNVFAATVLSDNFTGTLIDSDKWTEYDAAGSGGTTGNIQQNSSLSVTSSSDGTTALVSIASFSATDLEISAVITTSTGKFILGYGDREWSLVGHRGYLLYNSGSGILGLAWNNGVLRKNVACGTMTSGATYKMKVIVTGFEVYKNDVLQCTVTPIDIDLVDDYPIFLESNDAISYFDDVLVNGTVLTVAPDAPTIGTATAGDTEVSVSFTPGSNGGSAITGYTVTSNPGNITATGSASPITVTGLTNGVEYTFTVTATNAIGTSSPSAASNPVTPNVPSSPDQVTGLVAHGYNKQALLSWVAPDDGGEPISDYLVEYKSSAVSTWSTFTDGTSTSTKAIVTGLVNDTQYDLRVSAVNSIGAGLVSATATSTPRALTELAIVFNGESNSGGQANNSEATSEELASTSEVQILNNTSFVFENLDIGTNNNIDHCCYLDSATDHGFELQLANSTKANAFPDNPQIHLVKTGQGGSRLSQWNVGGSYWTKFLQRVDAAKTQLSGDQQWVTWISMGINDYLAGTTASTFKTELIAHINKIKDELPGTIVILTQFQSMSSNSGYPTYNVAMAEIAETEANVFVVDSTGADLDDGNHWSYDGLKTVGDMMVTITKTQLGLIYPGIPTNLNTTPTETSVSLSWTAPVSNGGSAITDYVIEYKTNIASTWSTFADGTSTTASTTVTGLTGGTSYNFRVSAVNSNGAGNTTSVNTTATDPTVSGGGGCYHCYLKPDVPKGGFKVSVGSGVSITTNRIVTLNFNAGSDVKKIAISLTGNFSDTNKENYSPTKKIDLCSKFGGLTKNSTCPDGPYTIYVKFYTQRGRASDVVSTKINLVTTPQFTKPTITFTKYLRLGSKDSQVKILQQFLNQNGFGLVNNGAGSFGKETDYFGQLTLISLSNFQEANKDKVVGLINEKGFLGSITREFINSAPDTTTATPIAIFTIDLYKGMQSEDVRRLQKLLATKPEIYPEGLVTGYFGPLTEKIIQKFQLNYGVVSSSSDPGFGYVGPKTRAKLQEVFGN